VRLALDTNAYSAAGRGEARCKDILSRADEIWVPFAVLAELRAGFAAGTPGKRNEAKLTEFLIPRGWTCFTPMSRRPTITQPFILSSSAGLADPGQRSLDRRARRPA